MSCIQSSDEIGNLCIALLVDDWQLFSVSDLLRSSFWQLLRIILPHLKVTYNIKHLDLTDPEEYGIFT